jgi:hypothetical protein
MTGAKQTTVPALLKTPPEWVCNGFPRTEENAEVTALEDLIATLNALVDTVTEADSSALGTVLHVAHILVTLQGEDGRWPAVLNLRTGKPVGAQRSCAPVPLFHRLNALLRSTEFVRACRLAENRQGE